MKRLLTPAFFMMLIIGLSAQDSLSYTLTALRINEKIKIDGKLDEAIWQEADATQYLITWRPTPGLETAEENHFKVLYDDEALYVSGWMSVPSRDSIMTELTQRDQIGNTDFAGFMLDTYGNGTDAFEFILGATGVQFDAKLGEQGEDSNWDAVWYSAVDLTDTHWSFEMKIPYSAIRFSNQKEQHWKINFFRKVMSSQIQSSWYPFRPEAPVFLAQMGDLKGVKDIKPPIRLSLSPYVSTYYQSYKDPSDGTSSNGVSYNAGMDIKYGINDAFTLDMILVPDFGQVQSDNVILNLTPFEQRYDERRPFFTEGTELFDKGGLFYSRRVGGQPIGYYDAYDQLNDDEELIKNPTSTGLINATKVSGRNAKGLGIGIFNAVSNKTHAIARDINTGEERQIETSPLTNYSIISFDKNLKNGSNAGLINTNVWRTGGDYYDANVTMGYINLNIADQTWNIDADVAVSQQLHAASDNVVGSKLEVNLNKIKGNFNYGVWYEQRDDQYNPNDLGFQSFNNERSLGLWANYSINQEFGIFNQGNFWFNYNYDRLMEPDKYVGMHFNTGFWMQTKSFIGLNMWMNYNPGRRDYYEPREWGRVLVEPRYGSIGAWIGSDSRKKLRISGSVNYIKYDKEARDGYSYNGNLRYRFNDRFNLNFSHRYNYNRNAPRYVTVYNDDLIFGMRNRTTINNNISANYNITPTMGLDLRVRHYWSKVDYNGYRNLTLEGNMAPSVYDALHDFIYNSFTVDFNYRWRFAPGSDLILNWKNNISGGQSADLHSFRERSYASGLDALNDLPQNNSLSLRLIYFLDYQNVKKVF